MGSRVRSVAAVRTFKVGTNGKVYCDHNLLASLRQAGTCAARPGEEFYECPYALGRSHCGLFVWKYEVENVILESTERRALQNQYERLEMEKDLLEREVVALKSKVDSYEACVAEKMALQTEYEKVGMEKRLLEREVISLRSKMDTYEAALVKAFGVVVLSLVCMQRDMKLAAPNAYLPRRLNA
ncbi:hypothetical protein M8C21_010934 [Ambrosia artemisiifolia]|uniref:Zinc finger GRF-type domain-containing protein n=1 Tax=Ambrosia artemisiifolia TaxID=4212 RepID=A0AAD5BM56_AMBAR|nr:hypothetical protein M8C21_010934 [Ambrosia artemisiifolia]